MKYIRRFLVPLLLAVALVVMGSLVLRTESEVLSRMQELSLWLPTKYFFKTSTIYPGGVLTWAAAYMTQHFYYPVLGMGLMIVAWGLIMFLTCRLFRLRGVWQGLSLLVPLCLLACLVQTGYWLYYMKLQGYPWVPTLGILLSLLLAMPYRRITKLWGRLVYMAVVGVLGYPLMGAWMFLTLALFLLSIFSCDGGKASSRLKERAVEGVLALVLVAIVPPIMLQQFYGQVQMNEAWWAAMPSFQYGKVDLLEYRLAYYAIGLSFLLCALCPVCCDSIATKKGSNHLPAFIVLLLLVIACFGVSKRWERDTNFHKEVAMNNAIERLDWEGVLRVSLSKDMGEPMPPTRVMVMMKNLALFRLGRAGDEMFHLASCSITTMERRASATAGAWRTAWSLAGAWTC